MENAVKKNFKYFFGVPGIEPRLRAPKARVLPLYYTPEKQKLQRPF